MAPQDHMHMVWVHSEFNYAPLVCCGHFLNELLQSIKHWANEYFSSPLRAEDKMIDNQMNMLVIMFVFHVDTIL